MDGDLIKTGDAKTTAERIRECNPSGKDELNLASLKLELFPGDVFGVAFIRTLNLRGNLLEYLPKNIDLLHNLEILNVSFNQLRDIPAAIGKLKNLEKLQLQSNKLAQLVAEIGQLESLRELYVGDNRIEALPDEMTNLIKLESFDARNNDLRQLPEDFTTKSLPNLRLVNLAGNHIEALPWSIKCLQDAFPVLIDADERRRLVKRSLRVRQKVNQKILV